jgi:hypothetical protein
MKQNLKLIKITSISLMIIGLILILFEINRNIVNTIYVFIIVLLLVEVVLNRKIK